ncbi:hypothetical protein, partial [Inquilinus sp. CAU 1745]|uniref:hypothetical protein n=1 Tax=Inquilinus sp. CAU 1745 TaxID=3140369 RepID=UPI00325A49EE
MTNKNNVMLDLIQHPWDGGHGPCRRSTRRSSVKLPQPMDSCVLDGCYDGSGKEAVGFEVARSVDRMLAWPLPARLA